MNERFLISAIGALGFVLVSLTSVVPVTLHHYGVENIFIVKASIGFLSLICGYAIVWGLFYKEGRVKPQREGKLRIRPLLLIIGILLICTAWFSTIPLLLSDASGLSSTFEYGEELLQGGLGTRIFVSLFTATGVLLVRFSFYRKKSIEAPLKENEMSQMLEGV